MEKPRILIYTDPHLGQTLGANTTQRSRERMRESREAVMEKILAKGTQFTHRICVGDFFDRYQNPEQVIIASAKHAKRTDFILGGNHDVINDKDKVGSLHLLQEMLGSTGQANILLPVFDKVVIDSFTYGDNTFFAVPHHSSKDLFEQALKKAENLAAQYKDKKKFLLLHCNYASGFAKNDTELNLTQERAIKLLKKFDYIIIGHDHHFKTDLGDKVIVLGSVHPTSFSDAGTHHVLEIYDGEVIDHVSWEGVVRTVDVSELGNIDETKTHFLKITGFAEPSQVVEMTKRIKRMWDNPSCQLFALKSEVKVVSNLAASGLSASIAGKVRLTDIIEKELAASPELLKLWKEVSNVEAA